MKPHALFVLIFFPLLCIAQNKKEPIIDMHLHAYPYDTNGPEPMCFCYPISTVIPFMDAKQKGIEVFMGKMFKPECEKPIWSAKSNEALFNGILEQLEMHNVIAVTSGSNDIVLKWSQAVPNRILPSVGFHLKQEGVTLDSVRTLVSENGFIGMGEVTNQYHGIAVDDPRMDPYYELAQEMDFPIGIHMGSGAPGSPMTITPEYEAHLSNPL
ncbi:MAG: amidohydrolase family protein, partial [Bacteroidota bacterium]